MTKIYRIKKVPKSVLAWFELNFPRKKGFTYDFYWYYKSLNGLSEKIYGCEVTKDGEFYHNATQADIDWFNKNYMKRSK